MNSCLPKNVWLVLEIFVIVAYSERWDKEISSNQKGSHIICVIWMWIYWDREGHLVLKAKCVDNTTGSVRMQRDFLNQLIEKYFEQLIDTVRVLRPHWRNFKANNFKHYCAGTCQAHMQCTAARCTKHGAIHLFTLECWYGAVSCT